MPRSETVGIDDDWRLDGNVAITSSQRASMSPTVFGRSAQTAHRVSPQAGDRTACPCGHAVCHAAQTSNTKPGILKGDPALSCRMPADSVPYNNALNQPTLVIRCLRRFAPIAGRVIGVVLSVAGYR